MNVTGRSLVIVNFHSASLTAGAIRSARASSSEALNVVVVDNSLDESEMAALGLAGADRVISAPRNLGYAGGVNLGRRHCDTGIVIASNPDVTFAAGAIDRLADQLDRGAAVAGPLLTWDDAGRWLLPPSDVRTAVSNFSESLAARSAFWFRLRDRRRISSRLAFWSLDRAIDVRALSGAVMAIRLDAFDDLGGFDERFPLYFEESDFLRRVARSGRRIVYEPAARCRHAYNQSAGSVAGEAAAAYQYSEKRYFEKWNGRLVTRALAAWARPPRGYPARPLMPGEPIAIERSDVIVEASPLPGFATAAGYFPDSPSVCIPDEVWQSFRGEKLYVRVVHRDTSEVLDVYVLTKE